MNIDDRVREPYTRNTSLVKQANKAGTRYDVVQYGDSITANLATKFTREWKEFAGGWKAAPLGIGGTSVQELTWRLMAGGEKFAKDPKVVILLIGIINLKYPQNGDPTEPLDYLLTWMRAAMPSSKILLLNILPNDKADVAGTNKKYERLAAKHGIKFSTCGSDLNPRDTKHFVDGTHPASDGYRRLFKCLKPVVASMV